MDFSQDLNSTQPNSQVENSKKRPLPQEAEVQEEGGNDTTEAMSQKVCSIIVVYENSRR